MIRHWANCETCVHSDWNDDPGSMHPREKAYRALGHALIIAVRLTGELVWVEIMEHALMTVKPSSEVIRDQSQRSPEASSLITQ